MKCLQILVYRSHEWTCTCLHATSFKVPTFGDILTASSAPLPPRQRSQADVFSVEKTATAATSLHNLFSALASPNSFQKVLPRTLFDPVTLLLKILLQVPFTQEPTNTLKHVQTV